MRVKVVIFLNYTQWCNFIGDHSIDTFALAPRTWWTARGFVLRQPLPGFACFGANNDAPILHVLVRSRAPAAIFLAQVSAECASAFYSRRAVHW